jgi:hypothetical protein
MSIMFLWGVTLCGFVGRYRSWRWRQYISPKRWYLPTRPHDVTCQKSNIDIFTAVRTSDITKRVWINIRKKLFPFKFQHTFYQYTGSNNFPRREIKKNIQCPERKPQNGSGLELAPRAVERTFECMLHRVPS